MDQCQCVCDQVKQRLMRMIQQQAQDQCTDTECLRGVEHPAGLAGGFDPMLIAALVWLAVAAVLFAMRPARSATAAHAAANAADAAPTKPGRSGDRDDHPRQPPPPPEVD
ncbi:hypothetical protein CAOG_06492 [Capsaspora owczarzaki ATCC 30864]|uniref:Small integral membrane protein 14 n=1 Tax=Capsaspora owczarzaki (strain ATCC 30864) TaxID=595528 RepID=A0A0D2X4I6_CAPO3|nr:hypothetical protein CAOG_06492 [Capsaspora owczarzaki ATCC 30864]KJE96124.1 hypothetical protein CAOG_006492 [Capsaspora owczarzaki ATCC 30864]|eukprot:XP_004345241.1 hypothetical protein CAOG_06492 [Capsaspora owczarzaki ATCC 30864]